MYCCPECFGDRSLRRDIFPLRSLQYGTCQYCGSENVALLEPSQLAEYFELLISSYRLDPDGRLLIEWFREDWGLFQHLRMDDSRAKDLLAEIVNDGEIVRRRFTPAFIHQENQLGKWEALRDELRYRNRFFPRVDIDYDRLASLLTFLEPEPGELPVTWFRARIQAGDLPYPPDQMGAPRRELATHGRANPAGIPYLYLASAALTAISETRPHTAELACVGTFAIVAPVRIIDLRTPKKTVSPFILGEPEGIGRMRSDLPFLERLGDELTRPILQQAAAFDYTPSQFLCEFIKGKGYDGVLYRSSVSEGINLALFNPDAAICASVQQYRVNRVSVEIEIQD